MDKLMNLPLSSYRRFFRTVRRDFDLAMHFSGFSDAGDFARANGLAEAPVLRYLTGLAADPVVGRRVLAFITTTLGNERIVPRYLAILQEANIKINQSAASVAAEPAMSGEEAP